MRDGIPYFAFASRNKSRTVDAQLFVLARKPVILRKLAIQCANVHGYTPFDSSRQRFRESQIPIG